MDCQSKISCVTWNKYHKVSLLIHQDQRSTDRKVGSGQVIDVYFQNKLASSEYDGSVALWDSMTGKEIVRFSEHEKRCWSVDFNSMDPNILASGSDDSKVRLWSLACQKAVSTIAIKGTLSAVAQLSFYDIIQPMYAVSNSIPIVHSILLLAQQITVCIIMIFEKQIVNSKYFRDIKRPFLMSSF